MTKDTVKIGKIIKSDSHIAYMCRVYNKNETDTPISEKDYKFGQFVKIQSKEKQEFYGIIYNSQLYNPDYGNFGPRLTSPAELNQVFTPDYIDETAILLNILIIGYKENKQIRQEIPPCVISLNSEVLTMTEKEIKDLHLINNDFSLAYYSTILNNAGNLSSNLVLNIANSLKHIFANSYTEELELIKKHTKWQQTSLANRV